MPRAQTPPAQTRGGPPPNMQMPSLPFIAAAHEHVEPFADLTQIPGAAAILQPLQDVPAYGYLRHVWLLCEGSGGVIGAGVLAGDFPFNIFNELTLSDVNGATIYGPTTGFQAFLANLNGGYAFDGDPRNGPDYIGTINFSFAMRIPVEISHHDGAGSLASQNAASAYKLRMSISPTTTQYSTAPTTPATIRVRALGEYWTLPSERSLGGFPQETRPPRHGTAQYWSVNPKTIAATGAQVIQVARVGNLIRTLVFVVRDSAGVRVTPANMPDPVELRWDGRQQYIENRKYRRQKTDECLVGAGMDGVYVYSWDNTVIGHIGDGNPALWLPTTLSSRLEWAATFPVSGSLEILTNDVAPAEVDQTRRFVDTSATGFHPEQYTVSPMNAG